MSRVLGTLALCAHTVHVTSIVHISYFDQQVLLIPGELGKVHRCVELRVNLQGLDMQLSSPLVHHKQVQGQQGRDRARERERATAISDRSAAAATAAPATASA